MNRHAGLLLLVTAALAGCAAPRTAQPPPAPPVEIPAAPAAEEEPAPEEPEEEIGDYPLPDVRSEPALARYSPLIEAAHPSGRPGLLLARAGSAIMEAQHLLDRRMEIWNILSRKDELHFVAYYDSAEKDCREILERWPDAPEAAEAQYTLGLIQDYPHMTDFPRADGEYRLTIKRYPGTKAAGNAERRLRHLRTILGNPATDVPLSP